MGLLRKLQVDDADALSWSEAFLKNEDLTPVPDDKRTWGGWNFFAFQASTSFNINTWMIVSSSIVLGLSWWQAWICVWLGYALAAPFVALNARPGAIFHVTFPVVARTSFGLWGSLWCVFNRGVISCIWYGVQTSIGGSCVLVMLRAMWPSVNDIPNSIPASSGTTTRDFVCFFIFWFISLPFIWFPMHTIRHFFTVKAVFVPIAGITFFIWCIVKAHGVGPIVRQPGTLHGSELGWGMVSGVMACFGNMAALITNAPDFASRARYPAAAVVPQLTAIPIGFGLVTFLGVIVSSSSQAIYGEAIWSPIDLLGKFLDDEPSHATRFGVWFVSVSFIMAQIGTNISANSISAGCDLTALLPRYINIRRGGYIAAIVGLCMCPWNLLKSSSTFTTYLSAYSVFLSAIAGVMVMEYYVIRKGHYRVQDLYHAGRDGWYWYTFGINFRAYLAYVSGIAINVVGFAGTAGRTVPLAAIRIYQLSFFTGFATSALVYWVLNTIFPSCGSRECKVFDEVQVDVSTMLRQDDCAGGNTPHSMDEDRKSVASQVVRSVRSLEV